MEMLLSGDYTTLLAPGLLLVHLDNIILFHLESLRGFVIVNSSPVEQKSAGIREVSGKVKGDGTDRREVTGTPTLSL